MPGRETEGKIQVFGEKEAGDGREERKMGGRFGCAQSS